MSTAAEPAPHTMNLDPDRDPINDFSIVVATVNGSGSQTANYDADPRDLQDGHPGQRQEPVSVQYRRPAHLVHHPRQQGRLRRAA